MSLRLRSFFRQGGVLLSATLLAGCAGKAYPVAHEHSIDKNYHTYSFTADVRATHVIKRDHGYVILAEPSPDAAFSHSESEDMNLSLFGGFGGGSDQSEKAGEGSADESADIPLTGRAPYVLLARELLYRIGEMSINTDATLEQHNEMMDEAFKVIQAAALGEAPKIKHIETMSITINETIEEKDSTTTTQTANTGLGSDGSLKVGDKIPANKPHQFFKEAVSGGTSATWENCLGGADCTVINVHPLRCNK